MKLLSIMSIAAFAAMLAGQNVRANELKYAQGTVLIAAPSAVNGPTNQGIWFVNPQTKMFSLRLPSLPNNQVYEGWIVDGNTGRKVSTGIFRAMGGVDSDGAGPYAGPLSLNVPPLPGSDFVKLGNNIADGRHRIVVTVEPYPDFDVNPSGVGVLRADIPAGAMVGTVLMLENIAK